MLNQIIQGDCYELMKGIPDGSIDLVLTDPPYNTTECNWDKQPFKPVSFWHEVKRIIKSKGAIVSMASQPFTTYLINSNCDWFKYCWVWEKSTGAGHFNAKNAPIKYHEDIVIFSPANTSNGNKNNMAYYPQGLRRVGRLRDNRVQDNTTIGNRPSRKSTYIQEFEGYPTTILKYPNDADGFHPTQKPINLFEYLIKTYTNPGETVLDPFAGSGTTALAAHATGRQFLCFEKEPKYVEIANKRLALAQMQGRFEEMVG